MLREIEVAVDAKDKSTFEALFDSLPFPMPRECLPVLRKALVGSWHERHEDLADVFQVSKDPDSVEALYEACLVDIPYLEEWQNLESFRRKCTWALADTGTDRAKAALERLVVNGSPSVSAYAKKRIDGWLAEQHRKGAQ